jgi:hypothetical protein
VFDGKFGLVDRRICEVPCGEHQVWPRPTTGRDTRKHVREQRRSSRGRNKRIGLEGDAVVGYQVGEERVLCAPIIDSAAHAHRCFLLAERIPGDAETRAEVVPIGVDTLGGWHVGVALHGEHGLKIVAQTDIHGHGQGRDRTEGILDVIRHIQSLE